ncbi:ring-opening amidohydrolase [Shouchella hunanensis]|uniref:Cyclic amide hydrolase n=1 Tax=Shouchella hunanensis TaxID=766894 RepID=A0ABY7W3P9_9BACI|nr:ring-opening amidohydrolase [Shouchella hunanensis]WDF02219.1 ring-opening amidohydrolase [Shouchella hunanensis]
MKEIQPTAKKEVTGMNYDMIRCDMRHPGDVTALEALLDTNQVNAKEIKAIIAQTEGDGYARGYATLAFQQLLSERLDISKEEVFASIPMMMIGKTGGLMTPHFTLFLKKESEQVGDGTKRFSFGVQSTRPLRKEEIGTLAQVDLVCEAVKAAIKEANIEQLEDVKCVEIKCPWGEGGSLSKAAAALGSAVALGEVDRSKLTEASVNRDHSLYSTKTSVSAGQEQVAARVIVMGNSVTSVSELKIGAGVMDDALDLVGLQQAFEDVGLKADGFLTKAQQEKVIQVFVNAGADALPDIRGQRHTMHTDALSMHAGILAKAVANAVVGSYVGETRILCSAGSEHQGPQGANLIAPIVRIVGGVA